MHMNFDFSAANFIIGKGLNEQLLFVPFYVGKHLGGDTLGQKPEDPQNRFFASILKNIRNMYHIHLCKDGM